MAHKNELQNEFEHQLARILDSYNYCLLSLKEFRKLIDPYLKTGNHDEIILPMEIFDAELNLQEDFINSHREYVLKFSKQIRLNMKYFGRCEFCNEIYDDKYLNKLSDKYENKIICDECFYENFFICNKCKKEFNISEQGVEDTRSGDGYLCKDCSQHIGFPEEVVICPEECESAASSTSALNSANNGIYPIEDANCIWLKFVKKTGEYWALYRSDKGNLYEIGELDCWGVGSMAEADTDNFDGD